MPSKNNNNRINITLFPEEMLVLFFRCVNQPSTFFNISLLCLLFSRISQDRWVTPHIMARFSIITQYINHKSGKYEGMKMINYVSPNGDVFDLSEISLNISDLNNTLTKYVKYLESDKGYELYNNTLYYSLISGDVLAFYVSILSKYKELSNFNINDIIDIKIKNKTIYKPIYYICQYNNHHLLKYMLTHYKNINLTLPIYGNNSPLKHSAINKSYDVFNLLVESGKINTYNLIKLYYNKYLKKDKSYIMSPALNDMLNKHIYYLDNIRVGDHVYFVDEGKKIYGRISYKSREYAHIRTQYGVWNIYYGDLHVSDKPT